MRKSIDFQGKRIVYDLSGEGSSITLLHGFMESRNIWNDFAERLSQEFSVLTIDLPGHGESEMISEIHTMNLMADVVKTVLDSEGISQTLLVGHSMGGYVSLEVGRSFPALSAGIVLFHSHAAQDSEEVKRNRSRTINIVEQNHSGFIAQFIPDLFDQRHVGDFRGIINTMVSEACRMSPASIVAAVAGMRDRPDALDFLRTTKIPLFFIVGKQDSRVSLGKILEQSILPDHAELLLLDHVGHMGYLEAPEKTYQAIRHFAQRCFAS